jgi:parallel beta-helix repeat protein
MRLRDRLPDYTTRTTLTFLQSEPDYVVYKDGAEYVCVDQATGLESYRGGDTHAAINTGLTGGVFTYVKPDTYEVVGDITMHSDNILLGSPKETILNFTADKSIQIDNISRIELGGLKIIGSGHIDCDNTDTQEDYCFHDLWFKNITATDPCFYLFAWKAGGCYLRNVLLDRIRIDTTKGHGFQFGSDVGDTGILTDFVLSNSQFISCGDGTGTWTVGIDLIEHGALGKGLITNCVFDSCWESGFHNESNRIYESLVISNCIASNNGQKPIPSFGSGFIINGNATLSNCQAYNNKLRGVYAIGSNNIVRGNFIDLNNLGTYGIEIAGATKSNVILNSNTILNSAGYGIYDYYGTSGLHITNNILKTGVTQCILLDNNTLNSFGTVSNNYCYGFTNYGLQLEMDNSIISGNLVDHMNADGIWLRSGSRNVIMGNICKNNGQTAGNFAGLLLDGDYHNVIGNHFYDDQGGKTQDYGMEYSGAPDYCIVFLNNCLGNLTASIQGAAGVNTIADHNLT